MNALHPALLSLALVWSAVHAPAAEPAGTIRFNRDIRPLLSDRCFKCHGPDRNTRKADLRLDTPEGAFAERRGTPLLVPGKPEASELFQRIVTTDPDDLMPPPEIGKPLSDSERSLIREWIRQGAQYEGHWAFQPLQRPALPAPVSLPAQGRNPVDRFLLDRLHKEGLNPSPPADQRTLVRRLSLDLTGLPPTPETVEDFLADTRPDAWERLVDRLLHSPHYGERMAQYWLDLVRYADTVGYHGDQPYSVFPYREYVIDAFNANLPFDRFTIEQLAGDLLPGAGRREKVASGYNRLNMITAEGGAQDKEYLTKYAADRIRTTATTWLGATMGCAECHDHKFDPYTMRDFYSFGAFFADLKERGFYGGANRDGRWGPQIQLPTPEEEGRLQKFEERIQELESTLATTTPELQKAQDAWEADLLEADRRGLLGWENIRPLEVSAQNGTRLRIRRNMTVVGVDGKPDREVYTVLLATDREHLTGIRLEAFPYGHKDPAKRRLGLVNGNFILTGFEVEVADREGGWRKLKVARAEADYSQKGFEAAKAIDGKKGTGWAVDGHTRKEHRAIAFTLTEPLEAGPGTQLRVRLRHEADQKQHIIGKYRLSLASLPQPTFHAHGLKPEVLPLLRRTAERRDAPQNQELAAYFREVTPLLDDTRQRLAVVRKEHDTFDATITTTLVSESIEPRVMRILNRGNWMDESGPEVVPAVPAFLPGPAGEADETRLNRLDLARWLVSGDNPLTSRVLANRLWKLFFGTGLSKSLDDLGAQGESPVHPELLDWLATELRDNGWDIKGCIRTLVTSQAYRQTSTPTKELRDRDPFNRLVARQSRFRLPAETVRDNALAISGLLTRTLGGPSAKPYQPEGYYAQLNFPKRTYQPDTGSNQYRRGLYTHWQRTFLHPALVAFDAPSREECTAERPRSNTPLQALVLMNDPSYIEAARAFAQRLLSLPAETDPDRIRRAWEFALARLPRPDELAVAQDLLDSQRAHFQDRPEEAEAVCQTGQTPALELPAIEVASWTGVARALLNLHETISRY